MPLPTFFRLLACLLLLPSSLIAQIRFVSQAPPTGSGEIRVQFVLSNAEGDDFVPPNFSDFNVLVGPSVSRFTSMSSINGATPTTASSTTYTYLLAPKRKGKLQIGAASIRVEGKVLRSQPLTIQVNDATTARPSTAPNTAPKTDSFEQLSRRGTPVTERDLAITVKASQKRVYEQEPIMITYEIHAKAGVGLTNVTTTKKPELKGFWTQEIQLPHNLQGRTERRAGGLYQVATNLQYLAFPQQTGTLTISPASFDCTLLQKNDAIDEIDAFFNGISESYLKVARHTPPLSITVLPLPQPKPANFSGGVGKMKFSSQLLTPSPKTNDVATLRLTIEGRGNLRLLKAPQLSFPKSFESYAPKMVNESKTSTQGTTGAIHFDYTFVPRHEGKFTLPAAEFIYFDTEAENYKTLRTMPQTLVVEKGTRSAEDQDQELALRKADIRDIDRNPFLQADFIDLCLPNSRTFYLLLLLTLLGTVALSLLPQRVAQRLQTKGVPNALRSARKAHRYLRAAEKQIGVPNAEFYETLSAALHQYLGEVLQQEPSALIQQHIVQILSERRIPEQTIKDLQGLLSEIDFARFAPQGQGMSREHLLKSAQSVIELLQSHLS